MKNPKFYNLSELQSNIISQNSIFSKPKVDNISSKKDSNRSLIISNKIHDPIFVTKRKRMESEIPVAITQQLYDKINQVTTNDTEFIEKLPTDYKISEENNNDNISVNEKQNKELTFIQNPSCFDIPFEFYVSENEIEIKDHIEDKNEDSDINKNENAINPYSIQIEKFGISNKEDMNLTTDSEIENRNSFRKFLKFMSLVICFIILCVLFYFIFSITKN